MKVAFFDDRNEVGEFISKDGVDIKIRFITTPKIGYHYIWYNEMKESYLL
jgi:hypothetical protein